MESDHIIPYSIFFHFHSLRGQLFYFPTAHATGHDYSCLFAVGCVYSSSHYRAITLTSVWPHFCCTDWQFSSAIITWSNWMPDSVSSTLTISKYPRESLTVDAEAKSKRQKLMENSSAGIQCGHLQSFTKRISPLWQWALGSHMRRICCQLLNSNLFKNHCRLLTAN